MLLAYEALLLCYNFRYEPVLNELLAKIISVSEHNLKQNTTRLNIWQ